MYYVLVHFGLQNHRVVLLHSNKHLLVDVEDSMITDHGASHVQDHSILQKAESRGRNHFVLHDCLPANAAIEIVVNDINLRPIDDTLAPGLSWKKSMLFHKRTLPTESNPGATLSCDRWSMWEPRGQALRRGVLVASYTVKPLEIHTCIDGHGVKWLWLSARVIPGGRCCQTCVAAVLES